MSLSIRDFLDRQLSPRSGVAELTKLSAEIAAQPLHETVADLRREIGHGVTTDDQRRLHVLISELYHRCPDADAALVDKLRAEVVSAYEASRSGSLPHDRGRG